MAVLTKEDFMKKVTERIGEDKSDEAIAFMEDMTDTFNDLSEKASDTTDWKAKYEENDKMWRDKYTERFSSTGEDVKDPTVPKEETDDSPKTFEELFKTED